MLVTLSLSIVKLFLDFTSDVWGMLNHPYQTTRSVAMKKPLLPILIIGSLVWVYLTFAVVVKFGLSTGGLFLTFNLGRLFYSIAATFLLIAISMFVVGKLFGGKGQIQAVFAVWSFSYLPTLLWFLITTIFYVILPPPRTQSFFGQLFSIFYLFLSLGLLFWKVLLYFLTLRHAMRLTLWQTIRTTFVLWPLYIAYFLFLNRLEIFKIPFV
ncbi:hypothetical protein HY030_04465 [Candidatus Gottesmanbacteria bacterium]|nr:hypothetical protein [Candidatus Gottesmanbacteria bacterium]